MPQRTWQPKKRKRMKVHGFRARNRKSGSVLKKRRAKGRARLSVLPVAK